MSPALVARLEREIACACDPDALAAADLHACRCYWQQLIDAAALDELHRQAVAHLAEVLAAGGER